MCYANAAQRDYVIGAVMAAAFVSLIASCVALRYIYKREKKTQQSLLEAVLRDQ